MNETSISLVVPCFNEEEAIPKFYEEANRVLKEMNHYDDAEFVFVDDGSSDGNRFTKGIFPWVGFNTKWFSYENIERVAGKTKWSFWKLFLYSIDGIIGFSTKPLAFSAVAGILGILLSFIMIIFIIIRKLAFGDPVQGWASLVCIILFVSGVQLFTTGIAGLYISKIYTEVKQRPLYIIKEEN